MGTRWPLKARVFFINRCPSSALLNSQLERSLSLSAVEWRGMTEAQAAKVTLCGSVHQTEAHNGNWDLEVSHPPGEETVCAMVGPLLFVLT